ncbi:MAG: hypothetical protein JWQ11_2816 [Rhizobacter sp.]|nr:hypothetical protein [Rhizobacter sp.]
MATQATTKQVMSASAFSRDWRVDWGIDPVTQLVKSDRTSIIRADAMYDFGENFVVSVASGPPDISLRYCGRNGVDLNFVEQDHLLLAENVDDSADADKAAIRITFSTPVFGIGAFVSGYNDGRPPTATPFVAQLWLRLQGQPPGTFDLPIAVPGSSGRAAPVGGTETAPFVGARVTGGLGIVEACFDVSLMGNLRFDRLAISDLYGAST